MKKTSLFMLALASVAVAACAKPAMRRADEIIRRRRGETLAGQPTEIGEQDMQAVAQESSMVADGAQAHSPAPAPTATAQPASA
ncbi:hypothetical protein [Herbaspirillum sp. YR522]|uniref:hypothetical protein n=1 Tax=Herbaspirillum sp. YR522 TaxID=1144342 RepID=UPI00026F7FA6|nr:hypothetical protein [Herbaspirillum sp. YR522]EJN01264.1 hypothetical protein PMI40_03360 [Herbaspirillum sp. YR522]